MSAHVPEFPDIESAQRASRRGAAVSAWPTEVTLNGAGLRTARTLLVDIEVAKGKDPCFVYHSAPGIKIPFVHARPTTAQVDGVKSWKAC
jgi:hypothetical protein